MNDELENFADEVNSTVDETAGIPEGDEAQAESPETDKTVENEGSASTAEQTEQQTMVPLAAKQAEKERRQQAEERIRQLEQALQQQQPQNKPDIFDNPDAVLGQMEMKIKAQMSEEFVKSQHTDYDDVMDHYEKMVQKNPSLYYEAMQTGLPAQHAYSVAKQDLERQEIGDVASFKEKLRQELLAEIQGKKPSVPPNMTTVRNAGSDPEDAEYSNVNDELFDLLNTRKRR
jgi:transcription elongation GreA/GreB family factor